MQLALDLAKEPTKSALKQRKRKASMTPEQLAARRAADRRLAKEYRERKRAEETPEQVEVRRRRERDRQKFYRDRAKAAMTEEQLVAYRARRAAYMREWNANATPDQKQRNKERKARKWRETRQEQLPKRKLTVEHRVASGRCRCCAERRVGGTTFCEKCWYKNVARRARLPVEAWGQLKAHAEAQGLRCAYSGVPITPGAGMSLDHVVPKTSPDYPGDADWSNLVWVHKRVNVAKNAMRMPEFVEMCRNVVAHLG